MELEENMRLIAARIFSTTANKNFDLIYLLSPGSFARYAWTDCPGDAERWEEFSAQQVKRWFCDNPSQTIMVCPELAPAIADCADAGRSIGHLSIRLPRPAPSDVFAAHANSETSVGV
jgi:hypothetical protein